MPTWGPHIWCREGSRDWMSVKGNSWPLSSRLWGLPIAQRSYLSHSRAPHLPCGRGCSRRASYRLHRRSRWYATSASRHASLPGEKSLSSGQKDPAVRRRQAWRPYQALVTQECSIREQDRQPRERASDTSRKVRGGRRGAPTHMLGARFCVCAHKSCDASPPIKLGREAAYYCHFTKGASSVKATQRYMVRRFAFQKLPKPLQATWPRDTIISHFKFICSLVHWWQTNALLG